jgi:DNA-binding NtrC family response regulator
MKPVILLVDDERDLIEVLRDAIGLALPDYEAVVTTSLDDAEEVLAGLGKDPSLVCVDHKLGERTGLDFLEALSQRFPSMPKILFTGQAPPDVETRARALGAKVLWKPFGLSTWIGEVREMLEPAAA